MTLLLREVGRFLAEAGIWVGTLGVIAAAVAGALMLAVERRVDVRTLGVATVAAAVFAALAHRFDAIVVWDPRVAGRALPVVWAALGAAIATGALLLRRKPSRE